MPEQHEWEWLRQDAKLIDELDKVDRQLQQLRRLITTTSAPEEQIQRRGHSDRWRKKRRERREQLRQQQSWLQSPVPQTSNHLPLESEKVIDLPLAQSQLQPGIELETHLVTQSETGLVQSDIQPVIQQSETGLVQSDIQPVIQPVIHRSAAAEIPSIVPPAIKPVPISSSRSAPEQPERFVAKNKDGYQEQLKQEFNSLFEMLELQERQKHYLRSRWLDQVLWMEGRASKARTLHYRLRLTTIIGGILIPALVSLNLGGDNENQNAKNALFWTTFAFSQAVAISAATEQFFNYGDRWRHYRRGVESLKTQGWQFFQITGPYQACKTHQEAFPIFSGQVELILQKDVEVYSTQVKQAKKEKEQEGDAPDNTEIPVSPSFPSAASQSSGNMPNGRAIESVQTFEKV